MTKWITASAFASSLAAAIVCGALQIQSSKVLGAQSAPVVPAIFQPFYQPQMLPEDRLQAVRAALPYDRISLELTGGMFIPGGQFKLTLLKNGDATLWSASGGSRFGPQGDSVGAVSLFDFGKLNHLIAQSGLERLSPLYGVMSRSDGKTQTVTVSTQDRAVSVADYGGAAPVEVWAVERAIEAIGHGITWKPK